MAALELATGLDPDRAAGLLGRARGGGDLMPKTTRATYVCFGQCGEYACACAPRVCQVTGWGPPVDDLGYAAWDNPCLHGQLGVRYEHPTTEDGLRLHLHEAPDGFHQWADGDLDCTLLPEDLGELSEPITLEIR